MVYIPIGYGELWLCTWSVDRSGHGHGVSTVQIFANANGTLRSMIRDLSLLDRYSTTYLYSLRTTPSNESALIPGLGTDTHLNCY